MVGDDRGQLVRMAERGKVAARDDDGVDAEPRPRMTRGAVLALRCAGQPPEPAPTV